MFYWKTPEKVKGMFYWKTPGEGEAKGMFYWKMPGESETDQRHVRRRGFMAAGGAHEAFPPVLDQKTASCTAAALDQRGCYEISVPAVSHCQEKTQMTGEILH